MENTLETQETQETQEPQETQETQIIKHIEIVTAGIIKDIGVNNAYASWKNTAKGMNFIKENKRDFYVGIPIWLNITQNQLIGTENDELLNMMKNTYPWINNLLEIKNLVKT